MKGLKRIIVDSDALIALVDKSDSKHKDCSDALRRLPETTEYVTTESCLAEATYILPGHEFVEQLSRLVKSLPLDLACFTSQDLDRAFELLGKYQDRPMDFADASIVAIAERLDIQLVFTVDRRDFSIYRPKHVSAFQLIP